MKLAIKNFASTLALGGTVVLPSRLLAAVAAQQVADERVASGIQTWERPEILSVNAWLTSCWNAARFSGLEIPALLSSSQERELWQQLFEEFHPELFDPAGAARLAAKAAATVAEWHLPIDGEVWGQSKDSESFRTLHRRFAKELRDRGCMTRAEVWQRIPDWIRSGAYNPGKLCFVGFRQPSPAMTRIVEELGATVTCLPFESRKFKARNAAVQCQTLEQELETVARWARRLLEEAPGRRIGIFIPNPAAQYAVVRRAFGHVFDPAGSVRLGRVNDLRLEKDPSPFHLNRSAPLIREPLIAGALTFLELLRPRIRISDASAILRSPFLAGAAREQSARALADLGLRRSREIDVTLGQMEYRTVACELLTSVWKKVRAVKPGSPRMDLPPWSELFGDLIAATGWPGDEPLDKREQAVAESWNRALLALGSLGFVSGSVTLDTALARLRDSLFQASGVEEGDLLSPIQILDLSQAEGIEFDYSAAVGMSEEHWPVVGRLVPFVPPQLQRWANLPASSAGKAHNESHDRAAALFASSPNMLVTYAGQLAPQVRAFAKGNPAGIPVWDGKTAFGSQQPAEPDIQSLEDIQAPPFRSDEPVSGGVGVIKSQAACPFRAFAEYRLVAQRPEDACFGFDARERGGYLHRSLESVWKRLGTSEQLNQVSDAELEELVSGAVAEALSSERSSPFRDVISRAEQERLQDAIVYWLREKEKRRGTPFRVEHLEEKKTVTIGELQLRIRVDRIDRLNDGSVVLIDYKSGEIAERDLQGRRPKEPQLLVYAASMEEEVDGIFLAQVRPREAKTAGDALRSHFPPNKNAKLDWSELRNESRVYLRELAAEFIAGYAAVDPQPGACTYCNLPPLCRIQEEARTYGDEETE